MPDLAIDIEILRVHRPQGLEVRASQDAQEGRVGLQDLPPDGGAVEAHGNAVKEAAIPFRAFATLLFASLARLFFALSIGHVDDDSVEVQHPPLRVIVRPPARLDPDGRAVIPAHLVRLEPHHRAFTRNLGSLLGPVLRIEVDVGDILCQERVPIRKPQDAHQDGVRIQDLPGGRCAAEPDGDVLEKIPVPGFGLVQHLLHPSALANLLGQRGVLARHLDPTRRAALQDTHHDRHDGSRHGPYDDAPEVLIGVMKRLARGGEEIEKIYPREQGGGQSGAQSSDESRKYDDQEEDGGRIGDFEYPPGQQFYACGGACGQEWTTDPGPDLYLQKLPGKFSRCSTPEPAKKRARRPQREHALNFARSDPRKGS